MKPYLWQAKELHKFFLDMWQLKDLLAKQRKGKSEIHCEQTAVVSQIHVLQMQKAGRAIFLWKGSLEGLKVNRSPRFGADRLSKNETRAVQPLRSKALREWLIVDVLSAGLENKWRTG